MPNAQSESHAFVNADVDALIAQLTTDEARRLTTGVGWWRTAAVERLGIPAIKLSDGPNGVRAAVVWFEGAFDAKTSAEVVYGDGVEKKTVVTDEQQTLLRRAAAQSIVLLRNKDNILPLDKSKVKKIAVIGPNARQRLITGSGSAEIFPLFVVTPHEGIEEAFGKNKVTYVEGCRCSRHLNTIGHELVATDGEEGWRIEFFNHDPSNISQPLFDTPILTVPALAQTRVNLYGMQVQGRTEQWSVRLRGLLKPQAKSAEWEFSLVVVGRAKLYIDRNLVIDLWDNQQPGGTFYNQGTTEVLGKFAVVEGKSHEVEVLYNNISPLRGNAPADQTAVRLGGAPVVDEEEEMEAAEVAAKAADIAVVVVGLNHDRESEGHDRTTLVLPGWTNELRVVRRVLKANPKTIVVNQSGSSVEMPWADEVPAILQAWYAGNSAGDALADVLTGAVNPSAKLSLTFPRALTDVPSHGNFGNSLGPIRYAEGLWVGYKHYIDRNIEPLWAFGYGLSYTTFEYSDLKVSSTKMSVTDAKNVKIELSVTVANTGTKVGSEVIQVYLSPPAQSQLDPSPTRVLKGFVRVKDLHPGTKQVTHVVLDKYAFSLWDEAKNTWLVASGTRKVLVAASSVDMRLQSEIMVESDVYWSGL